MVRKGVGVGVGVRVYIELFICTNGISNRNDN